MSAWYSYVPYNKSKLLPYSFPFASLVPYTQAVAWAQYGVSSVLRQSWVTQAMLYILSSQGIFPLTSLLWVTLVDEWFFCSNWRNIGNPGKQQTCWELCGDLEPWEESGWSFISLHVAWLTLITAFFSILFNQKFLFSLTNLCKYTFPSCISSTQHQGKPGHTRTG